MLMHVLGEEHCRMAAHREMVRPFRLVVEVKEAIRSRISVSRVGVDGTLRSGLQEAVQTWMAAAEL